MGNIPAGLYLNGSEYTSVNLHPLGSTPAVVKLVVKPAQEFTLSPCFSHSLGEAQSETPLSCVCFHGCCSAEARNKLTVGCKCRLASLTGGGIHGCRNYAADAESGFWACSCRENEQ